MTRPILAAESERLVRSLTQRLLVEATPVHRLSPIEERLLAIAKFFFIDCVLCVRAKRIETTGESIDRVPFDAAIVTEGARLALAAAIEIEAPLRESPESIAEMEIKRMLDDDLERQIQGEASESVIGFLSVFEDAKRDRHRRLFGNPLARVFILGDRLVVAHPKGAA